ncbi:response regulator [Stappia sp.]|uniref:response regulator n=1 Tax=Stappia sp. TaxID=1870903 RepID=UPI003D0FC40A
MSATTGGDDERRAAGSHEGPTGPLDGPSDTSLSAGGAGEDARISVLLHDLRTPLSAMRTAVEIIDTEPTTPRQTSAIRTLEMAIDALLSMTAEGLSGAQAPRADDARDLVGIIRSVTDLFAADARARGLASRCEIAGALDAYSVADPLALRRILSVLYDNALKYTGEGGIALTAALVPGGARPAVAIRLADTGIGIPPEERPLLFRARQRGDLARGTASGTGLGLWSAARLAAAQGGGLTLFESSPQGSCFELRLPLLAPAADVTGARDPEGEDRPATGWAAGWRAGGAARGNVRPVARRRLLVVDDNEANRRMMEAILGAFGCDTVLAESGEAALERLAEEPFDAVLLDINMPGMDGVATLAGIRARTATARLPVIGITAATLADRPGLEAAGFDALMEKPVLPAMLFSALDRAILGRAPG